ncbi:MAG: ComEC/Rec2 family competence protein [Planctomycetota bacterium]
MAAAALTGAAAWPCLGPSPWLAPAGWLFASLLLAGWAIGRRRGADSASAIALLASVAALAGAWMDAALGLRPSGEIARFASVDAGPAAFDAVIAEPPTERSASPPSPFRAIPSTDRTIARLHVTAIRDGVDWTPATGGCELTVEGRHADRLRTGDRVRVFAQLRRPQPATGPGQRDADLAARARGFATLAWAEAGECVALRPPHRRSFPPPIEGVRRSARAAVRSRIGGESGAIAGAVALGDRGGLERDTIERFRRVGLLHVLVVSGLHVGLVAGWAPMLATLGWLPVRTAWLIGLASAVGYAALTGGATPAVRATLVVAAATAAAIAGRRALSVSALAAAAIALVAASPGAWVSPGTRLSFFATATLLVVGHAWRRRATREPDPLERLIRRCEGPFARARRRLRRVTFATAIASATVFAAVAPLVAEEFHLLPWASVPLSLVAAPLTPMIVLAGLATTVADAAAAAGAPLAGLLADASAGLCHASVATLNASAALAANTPGLAWHTAGPPAGWSIAWIACTGSAAAVAVARPAAIRWALVALLALAVWWAGPIVYRTLIPAGGLRCDVIAVGHGAATLVRTPQGGAVLVDAGALGEPDRVADRLARALWARGVARLDAVLLSHPDVDHYNGVPGLVERFDVRQVATTEGMFPRWDDPEDRTGPAELRRLLDRAGVPIATLRMGQRLPLGGATLVVLHPADWDPVASDNANSLVVGLEHAGRRLLLPGDLEGPGLERLTATEPYDCDVLVAPHHGSRRSDPPGFAAWCRPESVAISSGRPAVDAEVSYRGSGARVRTTHGAGDLAVRLTRQSVAFDGFRRSTGR